MRDGPALLTSIPYLKQPGFVRCLQPVQDRLWIGGKQSREFSVSE